MSKPMRVYTTDRTKNTIRLMQADGNLTPQEYKRIKEKYSRMLFGIIRARISESMADNNEIENLTDEVIDDVFTGIKEYQWSYKFRSFLKKKIEATVWDKIHELQEKGGELSEEKSAHVAFRQAFDQKAEELSEGNKVDIVLKVLKDFVLPELRNQNETYYKIFHLKAINELDYKAIALELGITVVNARKGFQLAHEICLKLFEQYLNQMPFIDETLYDKRRLMKILPLLIK